MNILDRLTYKIIQLNNPQEKQMYQDIYDYLSAVIDCVAKTTQTSKSNLTERIEFDIDFLWDECRSIIFYTTLDNHEKKYLLRFDLWHTHYEFQFLYL
jgi:hypothetical protein